MNDAPTPSVQAKIRAVTVSDIAPSAPGRFERFIERIPIAGCWLWTGALNVHGYGKFGNRHADVWPAHRFSWVLHKGDITAGAFVCHHCDVPSCVNPTHLYLGNYFTNFGDALRRGRWKHPWGLRDACARGHPYAVTGVRIAKDGSRVCKECMRQHDRNFKQRRRNEQR